MQGEIGMPRELLRIIVVEDHPSVGQTIERILNAGGFAPILFASAEAALEANAAVVG
jgi:DNA-binding response OmpR family regulator